MRHNIPAIIALSAILSSLPNGEALPGPLDRYAWNARLFVVFADDVASAELNAQRADIAANIDGYRDRDLIVFVFSGDRLIETLPRQDIDIGGRALRAQLALPSNGFAAALIGLDTGVALLSAEPIDACALFREIDGMPIRRDEIETRGGAITCRSVSGN